ncbi:unnamed protein product [Darwinula stevensoni]|uniref:Plasminogen n=1 Tax=Darwinula stevensoni TaxID=69355 RepID=A0A7R8XJ36_9CRUS|nr:unnamed protein product [Darwinula stevensoni]CAG0894911.1 unnamed protein product [Darwinula stevensoni]
MGQRYGNVSEEMNGVDFSHCSISCMKPNESHPCHAFNFREADGSCQLIRKSKSHIVKSEGYQAYVLFLCLTGYPKIQNAEEAFQGWSGAYPAPRGGQVTFTCKHPRGFTDDHNVHMATCASMRPDVWCTTFTDKQTTILCPPPLVIWTTKTCHGMERFTGDAKIETAKFGLVTEGETILKGTPDVHSRHEPRTNDHVEEWHNKLGNSLIGRNHPPLLHFLDVIAEEQSTVQQRQIELDRRETLQKRKKCDITRETKLKKITEVFDLRPVLDLLRVSCVTEHPKMENMTVDVTYKDWDGKYPAPPGATVTFSCPAMFNDGSFEHNATCSFLHDHAWDTSYHKDVRCPPAVYPNCRLSGKGKEYIGTRNVTDTGKSCLRWDSEQVISSYMDVEAGFNYVLSFDLVKDLVLGRTVFLKTALGCPYRSGTTKQLLLPHFYLKTA